MRIAGWMPRHPPLDARLVLILANHIGDAAVLREAIALAIATAARPGSA